MISITSSAYLNFYINFISILYSFNSLKKILCSYFISLFVDNFKKKRIFVTVWTKCVFFIQNRTEVNRFFQSKHKSNLFRLFLWTTMAADPETSSTLIIQAIRSSGLNFCCQETPYSVHITLRKSFTKSWSSQTIPEKVSVSKLWLLNNHREYLT